MLLPEQRSRVLTRELLYTAVTHLKKLLRFMASSSLSGLWETLGIGFTRSGNGPGSLRDGGCRWKQPEPISVGASLLALSPKCNGGSANIFGGGAVRGCHSRGRRRLARR